MLSSHGPGCIGVCIGGLPACHKGGGSVRDRDLDGEVTVVHPASGGQPGGQRRGIDGGSGLEGGNGASAMVQLQGIS